MRSHGCGDLRNDAIGEAVQLYGWVDRRRDHGGVIFIDLRDRSGTVQITVDPDLAPAAFAVAERLRNETVLQVEGKVRARPAESLNERLATGAIEVLASGITVLNEVRGNLAAGGKGVAQPLTERDWQIARAVGPVLAARGLLLVGLDIIGDCLTEVNVTSPTCFREITDQTGCDVPALFMDALEHCLPGTCRGHHDPRCARLAWRHAQYIRKDAGNSQSRILRAMVP
jgi:hypothetical protein